VIGFQHDNKRIASSIARVFGGTPRVTRFWDDRRAHSLDILSCSDRPQDGVTSFSTIGLSDHPLFQDGSEFHVRVELVGAVGSSFQKFDDALASAGFCIINSRWFCCPGAIFPDVLSEYNCSKTMRHFYFMPPFLWESRLQTMTLGQKKVAWLMPIPISEAEREFVALNGRSALEGLFAERQIDVFNLNRRSEV